MVAYLRNASVTDLHHDITEELKDEESGVQAPQIKLIVHGIVDDLSATNHVLRWINDY